MNDLSAAAAGDTVRSAASAPVGLAIDATLWRQIEALAAARQFPVSAIAVAGMAAVLERISEGPVSLWCVPDRPASRIEPVPPGLVTSSNGQRSLTAAAQDALGQLLDDRQRKAAESGPPLWLFELDDADDALRGAWQSRHRAASLAITADGLDSSAFGLTRITLRPPREGRPGTLVVAADHATVPAERARSLAHAWQCLMQAALRHPDVMLDDLPVAAVHDRAANWPLVHAPAACALADDPPDMAALFAAILGRWPDAAAVVWPQGSLTFAALDRAANAIAGTLRNRGAGPSDTVAVRVAADAPPGGSVLYLCATIAAFRIGCAVMPLGQQVPPPEVRTQVERIGARFVVCAMPGPASAPAGLEDAPRESIPDFPDAVMFTRLDAAGGDDANGQDGAAVILTSSGTTGAPKTTCLSQAMILAFLSGLQATGTFVPCPALMNANIGFDIVLADIWMPWMHGHFVVVLETDRRTPAVLATARDLGARFMSLSPSVATALLNADPHCLAPFRGLHVAGEALPLALAQRLEAYAPSTRVVNGYGPSETAPLSTVWPVRTEAEATIPLGHALPGYRVLVADRALRPLPAYWPGEFLIAPAAPALGYHDPAMSAAAFVQLPGEAGGRFFRSGDYGWIDTRGRAQFIGRRDRQLKLRGVRVELNGIEHRILTVPGVADAAVIPRSGTGMASGLLACVQPMAGQTGDAALADRIVAECRAWLPRAAVPARVVFVEAMPKGPSGKKAYRVLAEQYGQEAPIACLRTAPRRGSIEARLAALWQDFFARRGERHDALCLEDDVFALGADSLGALTMAERIEQVFGIEMPDDQMFMLTTIGAQAARIRATPRTGPAIARHRLSLRLLRASGEAEPCRGAVLGLPGIGGNAPYLGSVAANALHAFDIRAASVDTGGRSLLEDNAWLDCARLIAEAVQDGRLPRPKATIGFSLGGFLGWLVDRLLTASGEQGIPVINLDGGVPEADIPGWRRVTAPFLPDPASVPAARMLLLRRAALPGLAQRLPDERAWTALGVAVTTRCLGSVCHLDFNRPPALVAEADALATFAETGTCHPVADDEAPLTTLPGGVLFGLLRRREQVSSAEIDAFVQALPPGPVDAELRTGLTFLSLAAGDAGLASAVISRLVAEAPDLRNPVYAHIALLAQMKRPEEALAAARAWSERHSEDAALFARARRWLPPAPALAAAGLFTDGLFQAIDSAASRLRP
jgi:acyl-coenzyme A synthetase/AMP-(fatty) acid ligase/acyl carrier protein